MVKVLEENVYQEIKTANVIHKYLNALQISDRNYEYLAEVFLKLLNIVRNINLNKLDSTVYIFLEEALNYQPVSIQKRISKIIKKLESGILFNVGFLNAPTPLEFLNKSITIIRNQLRLEILCSQI